MGSLTLTLTYFKISRQFYGDRFAGLSRHLASEGWHAELVVPRVYIEVRSSVLIIRSISITFENVPSDYAILKITDTPEDKTGGDTLWASGYEVYDRLSPPIQKLADTLKAVHHQVPILLNTN